MVQKDKINTRYNSIIILGPTASGKTDVSIALAKKLNGEIINADSIQIYKKLNIGSAKATEKEQQGIAHHLLDIVEPDREFSVSEFKKIALNVFEKLINLNKLPIFVGGTGFYINSLISNLSYGKSQKNTEIRDKYKAIAEEFGNEYLYNILKKCDSESASKIHMNDIKRVIRAIEIYEVSGIKKSDIDADNLVNQSENKIQPLIIGLTLHREELYAKINKRVDMMVQKGLLDEVNSLLQSGLNSTMQSMSGIGYKELIPYFENKIDLISALDKIKQNTRRYAKRQLTWFKKNDSIIWYNRSEVKLDEIIDDIIDKFKSNY